MKLIYCSHCKLHRFHCPFHPPFFLSFFTFWLDIWDTLRRSKWIDIANKSMRTVKCILAVTCDALKYTFHLFYVKTHIERTAYWNVRKWNWTICVLCWNKALNVWWYPIPAAHFSEVCEEQSLFSERNRELYKLIHLSGSRTGIVIFCFMWSDGHLMKWVPLAVI